MHSNDIRAIKFKPMVARAALWFIATAVLICRGGVAHAAPTLFPAPMKATVAGGSVPIGETYKLNADEGVPQSVRAEYAGRLAAWGFKPAEGGLLIKLTRAPITDCRKAVPEPVERKSFLDDAALQMYFLTTTDTETGGYAHVRACGEDGFFYALMTLRQLINISNDNKPTSLAKAGITDAPSFPIRGVFEGAYGKWDMDSRLKVIDWMGRVKLNSYIYGPKSDDKISRRWREPYSDIELFGFRRMMERARRNHVQVGYIIRPTLGMEYGSDTDFKLLLSKVRIMQGLGMKTIILAFDDSLGMVYSPADRKRFANLGEAEAFLANRLFKEVRAFDPEAVLAFVPEIYGGVWDMAYTRALVQKLNPAIFIGWTGLEIGTPKLDAADVQKFLDFYKRRPSFGDNWGTLFPMLGRNPDLASAMTQFMMNPYNLFGELPIPGLASKAEAELMPIQGASLAAFGWNAASYNPDTILDDTVNLLLNQSARDAFQLLMYRDLYTFIGYYPVTDPYLSPIEALWRPIVETGDPAAAKAALDTTLIRFETVIKDGAGTLTNAGADPALGAALGSRITTAQPWLRKCVDALGAVRDAGDDPARIKETADLFLKTLRESK